MSDSEKISEGMSDRSSDRMQLWREEHFEVKMVKPLHIESSFGS